MGFNTVVFVRNDGFHDIADNPDEFVSAIRIGMNHGGSFGVGCHANCVEVMPAAHADVPCLFLTHGGRIVELVGSSRVESMMADPRLREIVKADLQRAKDLLDRFEQAVKDAEAGERRAAAERAREAQIAAHVERIRRSKARRDIGTEVEK